MTRSALLGVHVELEQGQMEQGQMEQGQMEQGQMEQGQMEQGPAGRRRGRPGRVRSDMRPRTGS